MRKPERDRASLAEHCDPRGDDGVRRVARAGRLQSFVRAGVSHRHGVAGRGRHQEGLLCRQRRRDGHGVDRGIARHAGVVVAKKGLASAAELKGKVVGTSSIKSGSTILLRRLLKARGLAPSDYDLVSGQGSAQIFSGLQAGALDAVWLVPPQSLTAASAGYPVIGAFKEVAPKFPFVCFVTNDAWVKSNTAAAQGFAKAWLAAVAWLYDPANRAEAVKLLADELKLSPEIAAATYDELIMKNADTYPRDGNVDLGVLRAMIDIMVEGEELPAQPQGDIRRFLDDTML